MANTIWAIGRNYTDHAQEMKAEVPKRPLVFIKSFNCLTTQNQIQLPDFSQDIHHEIEVAVELSPKLKPQRIALALDLTARDEQSIAKKNGEPWTLAKSFKGSCPISPWIDYKDDAWFENLSFHLKINQQLRQMGKTKDMIFKLPTLIDYLSQHFPLEPNDIILTGTPAGVAALKAKDQIEADLSSQIFWRLEIL